ncbi:hypothetical protein CPC08DRAFT_44656 [Agrocybe pediades]|nr:hypothetical protein CPC08DRAFT_44656 [Agrocybe pediades]
MFSSLLALLLSLAVHLGNVACTPVVDASSNLPNDPTYGNTPTHSLQIKDEYYGIRNVSYWVTSDNVAVIDGDVLYPGTVDDIRARKYTGEGEGAEVPALDSRDLKFGHSALKFEV